MCVIMGVGYRGGTMMIFYGLALIPTGFLIYTLLNLKKLGIPLYHPRVLVEFLCIVIFCLLGYFLKK